MLLMITASRIFGWFIYVTQNNFLHCRSFSYASEQKNCHVSARITWYPAIYFHSPSNADATTCTYTVIAKHQNCSISFDGWPRYGSKEFVPINIYVTPWKSKVSLTYCLKKKPCVGIGTSALFGEHLQNTGWPQEPDEKGKACVVIMF